MSTSVRLRQLTALVVLLLSLTACKTSPSPNKVAVTVPPIAPAPTATLKVPPVLLLGDLSIFVAAPCTLYNDASGHLWISLTIQPAWTTAFGPFPATNYILSTSPGTATTSAPITSDTPFTAAVGGQLPSVDNWPGQLVQIHVVINPNHDVPESNYNNDYNNINAQVPVKLPVDLFKMTVPCFGI
jgi:hypothetical protein